MVVNYNEMEMLFTNIAFLKEEIKQKFMKQ